MLALPTTILALTEHLRALADALASAPLRTQKKSYH